MATAGSTASGAIAAETARQAAAANTSSTSSSSAQGNAQASAKGKEHEKDPVVRIPNMFAEQALARAFSPEVDESVLRAIQYAEVALAALKRKSITVLGSGSIAEAVARGDSLEGTDTAIKTAHAAPAVFAQFATAFQSSAPPLSSWHFTHHG